MTHLPKGTKVLLACHGHGCPFAKKTFAAPKSGKLALASVLKQAPPQPGHSTVDHPDHRAPTRWARWSIFTDPVGQVPDGDVPVPATRRAHSVGLRPLVP